MLRVIGNDQNLPRQEHAVASGTLPNGKPVVVNSDGTVSVVAQSGPSTGTSSVFETGFTRDVDATYDTSTNRVVIAYYDDANSDYGTVVVGTVSGTSISFGTPVVVNSSNMQEPSIEYDATAERVVVTYRDEGSLNAGRTYVGTVSGTSISFGSSNNFESSIGHPSNVYVPDEGKTVTFFKDNSQRGNALVGTVSSTSISYASPPTVYHSAQTNEPTGVSVGSSKIVVAYVDGSDLDQGKAVVATVSGNSISFGSHTTFNTGATQYISAAYDSTNDRVVIFYRDIGNSGYGTAVVGTVSGTSISFGSEVTFLTASMFWTGAAFDSSNNKVVVACRDVGTDQGKVFVGTVSGTSISFDSGTVFDTDNVYNVGATFDSDTNQVIIGYRDGADSSGTAITFSPVTKNITSENYIGISRSGAASGAGAIIDTQGAIADIPVINYVLSNASYDSVRFNSSSQDGRMSGIAFNTDGTKMYLVGTDNDSVYQYSLSTPFNVSTASYDSVTLNVSSQSVFPTAIEFNNDGTKMFIGSSNTNGVFQYSLSSGFDLSTASYDSVSFNPSSQESNVQGIQFNNDGTKMYIIGTTNNTVFQYSLSSAFNLSTASYDSVSFSVASQNTSAQGLEFNNDGTKLFVIDNEPTEEVYQYDLTTGFDISTASYSNIKLDVSSEDSTTFGISFNADGSKMYLAGQDTDYIYQYSTAGSSLTAGQSYYVQTDGTLSTTADDPSVFAGTAVSATELIVKG